MGPASALLPMDLCALYVTKQRVKNSLIEKEEGVEPSVGGEPQLQSETSSAIPTGGSGVTASTEAKAVLVWFAASCVTRHGVRFQLWTATALKSLVSECPSGQRWSLCCWSISQEAPAPQS